MSASSTRPSWGLRVYVSVMILLFVLSILGMLSTYDRFGILVAGMPIAAFMALGALFWSRPWVVATLVGAVAAFSVVYVGTAPRTCLQVVEDGVGTFDTTSEEGCNRERLFLPDLSRPPIPEDRGIALALGGVSGFLAGSASGLSAYGITRLRKSRASPA